MQNVTARLRAKPNRPGFMLLDGLGNIATIELGRETSPWREDDGVIAVVGNRDIDPAKMLNTMDTPTPVREANLKFKLPEKE